MYSQNNGSKIRKINHELDKQNISKIILKIHIKIKRQKWYQQVNEWKVWSTVQKLDQGLGYLVIYYCA